MHTHTRMHTHTYYKCVYKGKYNNLSQGTIQAKTSYVMTPHKWKCNTHACVEKATACNIHSNAPK